MRTLTRPGLEEVIELVDQIDFDPIRGRILKEGWTYERVESAIMWYKRTLAMAMVCKGGFVPLNQDIDEVWHNHILHTQQYHDDCQKLFGGYIHHEPASLDGSDQEALHELSLQNRQSMLEMFGEAPEIANADCGANCPWGGGCRNQCGGGGK